MLDDAEKRKYIKTVKKEVNQMYDKSKRDLSPDEVKNYLLRFFLLLVGKKKNEFDFFLADRNSSSFFQFEVKSYPQDNPPDKEGLKNALTKANEQLQKGDKFFQNVLAPAIQLSSSWKKINLVCFPEIASRQQFRDLGLDEDTVKHILTAEELKSEGWFEDLGLADNPATEKEYKRLLAICIGSQYVSFNSQLLDFEKEDRETHIRLVGKKKRG